mmetsp:Transcript_21678/g.29053  ORF Transcript_21678/g.29053 Transcript_21678/m.29053 type:complete len:251 (-) Transcript_21678:53-805(-)
MSKKLSVQIRTEALGRVMFMFGCQVFLIAVVAKEVLDDSTFWDPDINIGMVFARFVCGIVLHMILSPELEHGLNLMKYAVNHPWKFINYHHAFLAGFLQVLMVMAVEFVNFLAVLDQSSFSDIVMNFTALVIISEFDDYFFGAFKDEDLKAAITDGGYEQLLMVRRTSSRDARATLNQNLMTIDQCEKGSEGKLPRYINVNFWHDRSLVNKLLYGGVYRVLKCVYTSAWFYFMPYATVICSYVILLSQHQ